MIDTIQINPPLNGAKDARVGSIFTALILGIFHSSLVLYIYIYIYKVQLNSYYYNNNNGERSSPSKKEKNYNN
jgi:hypothetical protein